MINWHKCGSALNQIVLDSSDFNHIIKRLIAELWDFPGVICSGRQQDKQLCLCQLPRAVEK